MVFYKSYVYNQFKINLICDRNEFNLIMIDTMESNIFSGSFCYCLTGLGPSSADTFFDNYFSQKDTPTTKRVFQYKTDEAQEYLQLKFMYLEKQILLKELWLTLQKC